MLSSVDDTSGQALPHDYLDDLESFFYVFCWVTLGYDGPNQPILGARRPRVLWKWDQNDASAAADSKTTMMCDLDKKATDYFGPVFQKILVTLHAFYWPHILLKKRQKRDNTIPRKHLLDLTEPAKVDYATVLGIIDQAIIDLESEVLNAQSTASTAITPTRLTPARLTPARLTPARLTPAWITQPLVFRPPPSLAHSHSSSSLKRQAEDPDVIDGSPKSKKQKQREYENNRDQSSVHCPTLLITLQISINYSNIFSIYVPYLVL